LQCTVDPGMDIPMDRVGQVYGSSTIHLGRLKYLSFFVNISLPHSFCLKYFGYDKLRAVYLLTHVTLEDGLLAKI
jgi:hypothetical protein